MSSYFAFFAAFHVGMIQLSGCFVAVVVTGRAKRAVALPKIAVLSLPADDAFRLTAFVLVPPRRAVCAATPFR